MKRRDWEERLDAVIEAWRDEKRPPFAYGVGDCSLFVASALDAQLESGGFVDRVRMRGYRSFVEAVRSVAKEGGLEAAVRLELGEPTEVYDTANGNVAVVASGYARWPRSLAVFARGHLWAPAPQGLAIIPLSRLLRTWMVR